MVFRRVQYVRRFASNNSCHNNYDYNDNICHTWRRQHARNVAIQCFASMRETVLLANYSLVERR